MTTFHWFGLAIIVASWVWIALVMRRTWPLVRLLWRHLTCTDDAPPNVIHHKICGGKCPRCGGPP